MPAKRRPDAQLQRALDAPTRPDPGDAVGGGGGAAAVALRWAGMQDDWVSSWNESFHTPPSDRRRAWWKMQKKEHSKLLVEAAARGLIPGGGDDGDDGVFALSGQRPPWNGPNGPNGDLRGGTPAHLGGSLQSN